jgi:hypothetical protein
MKKIVALIVAGILISACGRVSDSSKVSLDKNGVSKYRLERVCLDGVTYLVYDRGITVMLDKDSKIIPC